MELLRVRDLSLALLPDGAFFVRAPSRGVAARVPMHAVEILSFCSTPRDEASVERAFGPVGVRLYRGLADLGLLVPPTVAAETPVLFENFASLDVHRRMLADRVRLDAYARAIEAVVRPGMVVLDAGTGSGILAGLAARAGARVVYAVDNSDMIEVAAEVFRASGLGDRIRPIRADVADLRLPEPVDVVVTETFGALALAEGGFDDVHACCARNLAPGGRVIPEGVSLALAPVGDRALLDEAVGPFSTYGGVDLGALRTAALQRAMTTTIPAGSLLHPGATFARMPFPSAPQVVGDLVLDGVGAAPIVGFAGWFVLHLAPGVDLDTGPSAPQTHWRQQLFPVEPFDGDGPLALSAQVGPALGDRRGAELRLRWRRGSASGEAFHRMR